MKLNKSLIFCSLLSFSTVLAVPLNRVKDQTRKAASSLKKVQSKIKNISSFCKEQSSYSSETEKRDLEQKINKAITKSGIVSDSLFDPYPGIYSNFPLVSCKEYLDQEIETCQTREKKFEKYLKELTDELKNTTKDKKQIDTMVEKLRSLIADSQTLAKDLKDIRNVITVLPSYATEVREQKIYIREMNKQQQLNDKLDRIDNKISNSKWLY